ncbi:pyroglutamyl-peptidase I [Cellulosilyticum sp. ST5]|uniref:pyroglutamyl-peptidase I n=1 Tax=unclassified Cellulosilyticum TaxID=2643091 RepID=UPI000F8D1FE6|nr:pyroglutamyl-peptidase I [Cellulosilyticum sp. WCF-2]QEH67873.1 pyroglutamyl-peptidase I [Cellulosilyticum sp. WCF-2]
MKVLITGFDPFGGESINPALEAVMALPDKIDTIEVIKLEIPTVFGKSLAKIKAAIELHQPDIVISVGQAGGRFGITPERIAINVDDARIKDNEGNEPVDVKVADHGPAAYFSNLPIKAMTQAMIKAGIPASVSNSAGTFVCNHVMYGVLHMIHTEFPTIRGGFIHVPYIPAQVTAKPNMPSMSQADITKGLALCIQAAATHTEDLHIAAGAIC